MLLSNPVIENAVNPNAAQIFASSPTSFRQMVLDCVLASKRVEGKIIAHQFEILNHTVNIKLLWLSIIRVLTCIHRGQATH